MRLLYVTHKASEAYRYYRGLGKIGLLPGVDVTVMEAAATPPQMFCAYDWAFFENAWQVPGLVWAAKSYGCKIWIDEDDNRMDPPPPGNPGRDVYIKTNIRDTVLKIYETADLITVARPELAELISAKNVQVVKSTFGPWFEPSQNITTKPVGLFWRGTHHHLPDFDHVQGAISGLSERFSFSMWGYTPHWMKNVNGEDMMPLHVYLSRLSAGAVVGGVMVYPLANNRFNRCKSEISWIEATLAGMPIIYPVWFPPSKEVPCLTYSTDKGFKAAVESAMKKDLSGLVLEARQHLAANYGFTDSLIQIKTLLTNG